MSETASFVGELAEIVEKRPGEPTIDAGPAERSATFETWQFEPSRPTDRFVVDVATVWFGRGLFCDMSLPASKLESMQSPVLYLLSLSTISCLLCGANLHADTIHLRSGGTLEGKVLNADESPRKSYRIRLDRGGDVTLEVSDVRKVEKLTRLQSQYRQMLQKMPDTVEAHMKMYELCKKHSLQKERQFHLQQVVRIDPDHEKARSLLKYKRTPDGGWAKVEEIKESAGFVRWKGKWVTPEEAQRAELAEQREAQQIEWKKKIKRWREWLGGRRQSQALAAFKSIDDPLAVKPLVEVFTKDNNYAVREMIAEILGEIGTPAAAKALANAAMQGGGEDGTELRLLCVRILERNNLRGVASSFVPYLRNANNAYVRRAAYAIGELGDESMVLPLIKALKTKHIKLVGGAGDGRINVRNGAFSVGQSKPKKVPYWRDNKEVRDALAKLTDAPDFGYSQGKWLEWYHRKNTPPSLDLRRDA